MHRLDLSFVCQYSSRFELELGQTAEERFHLAHASHEKADHLGYDSIIGNVGYDGHEDRKP